MRLTELVAALSLATDLGLGQPQDHVMRQTVIAQRIAQAAGVATAEQETVFYVSMLAWVGCLADSHELAKWFGDDRRLRADSYDVDMAGLSLNRFILSNVGAGSPPWQRLTAVGRFLVGGFSEAAGTMVSHCQTTGDIAERLGLAPEVRTALGQSFERWDGKGVPDGLAGDRIELAMRIVQIADDAEVFLRVGGADAAMQMLRSRRGREFDPDLVDLVGEQAQKVLAEVEDADLWPSIIAPDEGELTEQDLDATLLVLADYADLKAPSFLGHSRVVGELAAGAASRLGLPASEVTLAGRAGLVHDVGVVGVSTGIWDNPGRLAPADRERVRTHPYLTERVLARTPRLAEIGAVAALHHERLDGSGYPRGLGGEALPMTARVVAAADVCSALSQPRPHRDAHGRADAAAVMQAEVRAGRLDGDAVNAVLGSAGHRVRRRPARPAGLTPREVEVLMAVASGATNREIAAQLSVSARTVSSHVEHIYTKIGVSTRGAAAMFAMRHGLVAVGPPASDFG